MGPSRAAQRPQTFRCSCASCCSPAWWRCAPYQPHRSPFWTRGLSSWEPSIGGLLCLQLLPVYLHPTRTRTYPSAGWSARSYYWTRSIPWTPWSTAQPRCAARRASRSIQLAPRPLACRRACASGGTRLSTGVRRLVRRGFPASPRESCDESGAARLDQDSAAAGDHTVTCTHSRKFRPLQLLPLPLVVWRCRHRSSRPRAPALRCSSPRPNC